MNKKITNIILAIVAIVIIVLCFFATGDIKKEGLGISTNGDDAQSIIQRAEAESNAVVDNERKEFAESSVEHYLSIYNATDKKRLILVGSPSCGYCQVAEPIIQNIAYKYDIKIYYLDVSKFSGDDETKFIESDEMFASGFGTPMLLLVSEGKIHDSVDGLTDTAGYMEFFTRHGYVNE